MARSGINYDQVAAAADEIVAEGLRPTIEAIRLRLGTGSPNTVLRHLTAWRAARPQTTPLKVELPASVMAAIAAEIQQAAAIGRNENAALLLETQNEAAELATVGEKLEEEISRLSNQLQEISRDRDQYAKLSSAQAREITALKSSLEYEQKTATAAKTEWLKAEFKTDTQTALLTELRNELAEIKRQLKLEAEARTIAEQQAAVNQAKLEAANLNLQKAETRLAQTELQMQHTHAELSIVRGGMLETKSKLEKYAKELETAAAELRLSRTETLGAAAAAAELRGKLAALERQGAVNNGSQIETKKVMSGNKATVSALHLS
jgi:chromosome segregation ATPase